MEGFPFSKQGQIKTGKALAPKLDYIKHMRPFFSHLSSLGGGQELMHWWEILIYPQKIAEELLMAWGCLYVSQARHGVQESNMHDQIAC